MEELLANMSPVVKRFIIALATLIFAGLFDLLVYALRYDDIAPNLKLQSKDRYKILVRCVYINLPPKITLLAIGVIISSMFNKGLYIIPIALFAISFIYITIANWVNITNSSELNLCTDISTQKATSKSNLVLLGSILLFGLCCLLIDQSSQTIGTVQ